MKKLISTSAFLAAGISAFACSVCERNQPKVLRGITHGAGPESRWDYLIVLVTIAIVLVTLFFSVKWLLWPGEKSSRHIKRFILKDQ